MFQQIKDDLGFQFLISTNFSNIKDTQTWKQEKLLIKSFSLFTCKKFEKSLIEIKT